MSSSMASRLAGKTILITGASSGIGAATALEFARTVRGADGPLGRGLRLVLAARRTDKLDELVHTIKTQTDDSIRIHIAQLDVTDPTAVQGFLGSLPDEFKDVDILVNNAGLAKGVAQAPHILADDITAMVSTNLMGVINVTQAVLPGFQAKNSGDIINIGSVAGRVPYAGGSVYCASKAAVRSFTDALRKELIDTRIRIMEVDPGKVLTEFSLVRYSGDQDKADAVYKSIEPLEPGDIAEIVVFAAGRRENVVLADMLVFPSGQVSICFVWIGDVYADVLHRLN